MSQINFLYTRRAALKSAIVLPSIAATTAAADLRWPRAPVRFITPSAAGGGSDAVARTIAEALQKRWEQPVVIDNRPGADGALAIRAFLDAKDGHTLLFSYAGVVYSNPIFHSRLSYDPARDLAPITTVIEDFIVIAVTQSLGVNSLAQLISLAQKKPGQLNYTAASASPNLTFLAILKRANADLVYVPYRSLMNSIPDLVAGRVHVATMPLGAVLGQARAGKVKLLAVTNDKRCPAALDVPTLAEAGYPDLVHNGLNGLFGRNEMMPALRSQIARDVQTVLNDSVVVQRLKTLGYIARASSPSEFAGILQTTLTKLSALARNLGIEPSP